MIKLKIFAIIAVSFLAVKLVAPQVFLANTPKVNPLFIARVKNAPVYIASLPSNILNSLKTTSSNIAQKSSSTISSLVVKQPTVAKTKTSQVATNTGHSGPYVTSQPVANNQSSSSNSTTNIAPEGSTPLPISEQEAASSLDKLASVTPPAQAAFVPVASGVSTYTDTSTNKTILKIEKGAKYTVERYQLANGEIKDVIVIK